MGVKFDADFVFAVAGEELGLFVTLLIVALFAFVVLRGFARVIQERIKKPLADELLFGKLDPLSIFIPLPFKSTSFPRISNILALTLVTKLL